MSMAGFVATVPKWEQFEREWSKLLPPTVELFRMSAFASSKQGWEGWKGRSVKRVWFISQLVACIRKHIRKGFAAQIAMDNYRTMDAEFAFTEKVASPYSMVGFGCLKQLREWADKKGIDARDILCIFEKGDDDQGVFLERAQKDGFDVVPREKKNIRAFDACDLAAWRAKAIYDDAFFRDFGIKEKPTLEKLHERLDELEKIIPNGGVFTLEIMRTMCLRAHVPKRVPTDHPGLR